MPDTGIPSTDPNQPIPPSSPDLNTFDDTSAADSLALGAGAGLGASAALANAGTYIDSAIIRSRFQLVYDNVQGGNSDRAEFLYPAYNSTLLANGGQPIAIPQGFNILGKSRVLPSDLRYNELAASMEFALTESFSVFAELPVRFNDASGLEFVGGKLQTSGLADMNAGVRCALINEWDRYVTFQLKAFAPTGNAASALGTGHASLQPGFLFQQNVDRFQFFGEIHDWIGLGGYTINDPNAGAFDGRRFTGNVARYGLGASYALGMNEQLGRRFSIVAEFVGWTVLDGVQTNVLFAPNATTVLVEDARGETIVNGKLGLRYTSGPSSIGVGYGIPLTSNRHYSDIIRAQYQYNF